MPSDGASKHRDGDRGLFQPPAAKRPSRFSSPSRPPSKGGEVSDALRSWGIGTSVFCLVQSVLWVAMSVSATLVYRGIIPSPEAPEVSAGNEARWDDFATLLSNLYFREHNIFPPLPKEGLVTPRAVYYMVGTTLILNALWLVASGVMLRQMRLGARSSVRASALAWSASTVAVTVLDAVLGAAMTRDIALLASWPQANDFPGDETALLFCPVLVLVVSLRGGAVLVANVICLVVLLVRLAAADGVASSGSPSAAKREGPIDAFLYQNSSLGVQNPVFVPDEVTITPIAPAARVLRPWESSAPPTGLSRTIRGPTGPAMQQDDMSHLSWMEEVDKHVELRKPTPGRPSAPPHYRHGWIASEAHDGGSPYHHHASDSNRTSMLPRVRINPNAPKFPVIPPPDYSPPSRGRLDPPQGHHGQAAGRTYYDPRQARPERF